MVFKRMSYRIIFLMCAGIACWAKTPTNGYAVESRIETGNCSAPYSGPSYYVSAAEGNDADNGSEDCPFATIQHAADTVSSGDTVYVKAGVYRERLRLVTPGVTYTAFESDTPQINGSKGTGVWHQVAGQPYYVSTVDDDVDGDPLDVQLVIAEDILFDMAPSLAELAENAFFQADGSDQLFAYFGAGIDPNTASVGLIKAFEDFSEPDNVAIYGDDVTFSGFEVIYSSGDGISTTGVSNTTISGCTVKYANKSGIYISRGDGNVVEDCTVYHNSLSNYPRPYQRTGTWGTGITFFSGTNGAVRNNTVYRNHGEGISGWGGWNDAAPDGLTIEGNSAYDNWGVNIYLDGASNVVVDRNLSYWSGDTAGLLRTDVPDPDPQNKSVPIGIQMAKETGRDPFPGDLQNITVTNNVFLDCFAGITFWQDDADSGLKNVRVHHNTIASHNLSADAWTGISINDSDFHSDSSFANNIIHVIRGYLLVFSDPDGSDVFDTISFDHNGWYRGNPEGTGYFKNTADGGSYLTLAQWSAYPNRGEGSFYADPVFVSGAGHDPSAYRLSAGSVLVDAGVASSDIHHDYAGAPRPQGAAWDIGAFE